MAVLALVYVRRTSSRRWIEVGKVLALDATAEVPCPELCGGTLQAFDIDCPGDPEHFERVLRCDNCGAHNILYKRWDTVGEKGS